MKKRIFSRVLALFMALAMLSTTALADVSFDDLQEAINGAETEKTATEVVEDAVPADEMPETSEPDAPEAPAADPAAPTEPTEPEDTTHVNGALVRQETLEDGTTQNYFGYGWSQDTQSNWYYAIEAHDAEGNRYVVLLDDVSKGNGEASGVVIGQDGSKTDVTIDMNGHSITGEKDSAVITVNKDAELNLNNGTISGGQIGIDVLGTLILDNVTVASNGTGIKLNKDGKLTFKENNKFTDNDADVELTVNGKTYKVDADTAKALMEKPVATGTDWLLVKGKDNAYIVAYTGSGDQNKQLTKAIVSTVLTNAGKDGKTVSGFVIPDGITGIGKEAFLNRTTLTNINIPESVTIIGSGAFQSCTKLTGTIKIPAGIKTIQKDTFRRCENLKGIEFPENSECIKIETQAFCECSGLTGTVKIPKSVSSIGDKAFYKCDNLERVELGESVTSIGKQTFEQCSKLNYINIPKTVTAIGDFAFWKCSDLNAITIPLSVTSIGKNAFGLGAKSVWLQPVGEEDEKFIVETLQKNLNVFVVKQNGDVMLYRENNAISFGSSETIVNEDGNVSVSTSNLSISKSSRTTSVELPVSGVVVNANGNLVISSTGDNIKVTISNDTVKASWSVAAKGSIIIKNDGNDGNKTEVPEGSIIAAADGTFTTTSSGNTTIGKDGTVTARGEVIFKDKSGNTHVITGSSVMVYPTGTANILGNSNVDTGAGGIASYPNGAVIKNGQITSKGIVTFENESGGKVVVTPAEQGESITIDPTTGITTVPVDGRVTVNDEKNITVYPDGATVDRQGNVTSNGDVVYAYEKSSGTVTTPEGSKITVGSDGTITVPAGSTIAGVEYPYGATILPDGIIVANLAPFVVLPDFTFDSDTAGTGDGDDTTTIDDEAIPLAGLISRAQLVSYLYAHEGSPDGEDAEDEYALAWAWGVENEIVDEGDDPEEIVTVAILREIMTAYAKFLDTTFDVVIEEDDDMPVMNCDEILAEFYASLEDKAV